MKGERQVGKRQRAVGNQEADDLEMVVWHFGNPIAIGWKLVMEIEYWKMVPQASSISFFEMKKGHKNTKATKTPPKNPVAKAEIPLQPVGQA